jgi:hypothetical protein
MKNKNNKNYPPFIENSKGNIAKIYKINLFKWNIIVKWRKYL